MTFFFVYPDGVSEQFKKSLDAQGIQLMSLSDLSRWIKTYSKSLQALKGIESEGPRVEIWQFAPILAEDAVQGWLTHIWQISKGIWSKTLNAIRKLVYFAGVVAIIWFGIKPLVEFALQRSEMGSKVVSNIRIGTYAVEDMALRLIGNPANIAESTNQSVSSIDDESTINLTAKPVQSFQQLPAAAIRWLDNSNRLQGSLLLPIVSTNLLQSLMANFTTPQLTEILYSITNGMPSDSLRSEVNQNMTNLIGLRASTEFAASYEIRHPTNLTPAAITNVCYRLLAALPNAISNEVVGFFRTNQQSIVFSRMTLPGFSEAIYVAHFSPAMPFKWKTNNSGPFMEESFRFCVIMPPDTWYQSVP